MSHIHLPDGILPLWLCILGYLIVFVYLFAYRKYIHKKDAEKKIMLASIMAAFMLVVMSIEFFSYHFNLSALSGIILGPVYAPIAILIVNFILAIFKHGGISTIGLNTIVVSVEAISAYYLYKFLGGFIKRIIPRTFLSTFLALILSTIVSVFIIYTGTGSISEAAEIKLHSHDEVHEHNEINHKHKEIDFNISRFLLLIILSGAVGWTIESLFTAFIFDYINKIKPDIIESKESNDNESF